MGTTSSAEWARATATTITDYVKGETDLTLRNYKLSALMKARGRLRFNMAGDSVTWQVRQRQVKLRGMAQGNTRQFPQQNKWQTAKLPWRGYYLPDSIDKFEMLKNREPGRLIDVFGTMAKTLMSDAKQQFGDEFYVDGNASGNQLRMHGAESFLGYTAVTGKAVATPNDSYAGLNTAPGSYGGAWTGGDWPTAGTGPTQYDFWSPKIVNYTSTFWGVNTPTWATTGKLAIRYLINKSVMSKSTEGMLDLIMLDSEMYRLWLEAIDPKERIQAQRATGLVALGFPEVTNFDGVDITFEYGVPAGSGYAFNIDEMELRSMQDDIWVPDGPNYDEGTAAWRVILEFYGNMAWTPRYQGALKAAS